MELTFLGTGSAYPHYYRGASCTMLKTVVGKFWMFDCGEGSQIQIRKAKIKAGKVTKIFITHLHGDHLFGLPGFIDTYQENFKADDENRALEIYGPEGIRKYIRTCLELSRSDLQVPFVVHELRPVKEQYPEGWQNWEVDHISSGNLHPMEQHGRTIEADGENVWHLFEDDRFIVKSSWLSHRVPCFGFVIQEKDQPGKLDPKILKSKGVPPGPLYALLKQGQNIESPTGEKIKPEDVLGPKQPGRKIVILGDTCNSDNMEKISQKATVIVHEATLENEMREICIQKGHSTPEMAALFAKKIQAEQLILTHFSQRYKSADRECKENESSVVKLLEQAIDSFGSKVIAADDLLTVNIPGPTTGS